MSRQKEIETLMERAGFARLRTKRHTLWRHPSGAQISTSQSPSDGNAVRQVQRELRRVCQQWNIPPPE